MVDTFIGSSLELVIISNDKGYNSIKNFISAVNCSCVFKLSLSIIGIALVVCNIGMCTSQLTSYMKYSIGLIEYKKYLEELYNRLNLKIISRENS